ncbi:hypothetical protein CEUSTIGMA_g6123.t1 [Chlamydomonas eustigma]|uniref:Uncharacterized protein n=1 Tax=Chlamydomonas eustigma TaxID=1157962 RepID=A0A250X6J3_9CHLO|nr:hypothetical protein CEUSTIGMA_g6123.t1 [Chlamydomonas eustigma]|eukprot:GAX78685.1 hypothetical protein CEUSTIGMA_g6123.t1 [Chlamydomonas eustigma]
MSLESILRQRNLSRLLKEQYTPNGDSSELRVGKDDLFDCLDRMSAYQTTCSTQAAFSEAVSVINGQRRSKVMDFPPSKVFDGAFLKLRSSSSGLGSPRQGSPSGSNSPNRGGQHLKQRPFSAISSPKSVLTLPTAETLEKTSVSSSLSGISCPELPSTLPLDLLHETVASVSQSQEMTEPCSMEGREKKTSKLSLEALNQKSMLGLPDSVLVRIGRSRDAFMEREVMASSYDMKEDHLICNGKLKIIARPDTHRDWTLDSYGHAIPLVPGMRHTPSPPPSANIESNQKRPMSAPVYSSPKHGPEVVARPGRYMRGNVFYSTTDAHAHAAQECVQEDLFEIKEEDDALDIDPSLACYSSSVIGSQLPQPFGKYRPYSAPSLSAAPVNTAPRRMLGQPSCANHSPHSPSLSNTNKQLKQPASTRPSTACSVVPITACSVVPITACSVVPSTGHPINCTKPPVHYGSKSYKGTSASWTASPYQVQSTLCSPASGLGLRLTRPLSASKADIRPSGLLPSKSEASLVSGYERLSSSKGTGVASSRPISATKYNTITGARTVVAGPASAINYNTTAGARTVARPTSATKYNTITGARTVVAGPASAINYNTTAGARTVARPTSATQLRGPLDHASVTSPSTASDPWYERLSRPRSATRKTGAPAAAAVAVQDLDLVTVEPLKSYVGKGRKMNADASLGDANSHDLESVAATSTEASCSVASVIHPAKMFQTMLNAYQNFYVSN